MAPSSRKTVASIDAASFRRSVVTRFSVEVEFGEATRSAPFALRCTAPDVLTRFASKPRYVSSYVGDVHTSPGINVSANIGIARPGATQRGSPRKLNRRQS